MPTSATWVISKIGTFILPCAMKFGAALTSAARVRALRRCNRFGSRLTRSVMVPAPCARLTPVLTHLLGSDEIFN
ncbi:hypothetical protein [Nocardia pneumoniae]|uniref:hypothetical protein n=1 Tax=Nocardia pneumoniae TaxID=228601 RepID=UPI0005949EBA|nr:hypothetical protein [Nocardia pneumoniae]